MEKQKKLKSGGLPVLSIVAPCYNEEEALPISIEVLSKKIQELQNAKIISSKSFVLFVDDGSSDETWELIRKAAKDKKIRGLRLSANVGHQNALLAGLYQVVGHCDAVVSIDADLQDDVNAIDRMLNAYTKGAHVVLGVRGVRDGESDTLFKRLTAWLYYSLLNVMKVHATFNHADFRLLSAQALSNLAQFPERNLFLRALPRMLHRDIAIVKYVRAARVAGESKYPLSKMFALAWDGISSFSVLPLRFVTFLGVFISVSSLIAALFVLSSYFSGKTIPGWASITLPMYLLGGLMMLSMGIIGEYIAKIFVEVKSRPRFLIDDVLNME